MAPSGARDYRNKIFDVILQTVGAINLIWGTFDIILKAINTIKVTFDVILLNNEGNKYVKSIILISAGVCMLTLQIPYH